MNGVYCITNLLDGKRYVGRGVSKYGNGIERRFASYRNLKCKNQPHLYFALKKYGVSNFKFEVILETNDSDNADRSEMYLIDVWDLQNREKGYNISAGGDRAFYGLKLSKNHRNNISKGCKGKNTWSKGKKWTPEAREKFIKAKKGIKATIEAKNNMSKAQKGHFVSEETKRKISETKLKAKRGIIREYKNRVTGEIVTGTNAELSKKYNWCECNMSQYGYSKGWKIINKVDTTTPITIRRTNEYR